MMRRIPHEWPLVAFSSLAVAGAGTLAVGALVSAAGRPASALGARLAGEAPLATGLVLLGLGLAVSVIHLGRPLRAGLALSRIGASPLSNEVAAVGLTMALAVAALAAPDPTGVALAVRYALAFAAALLLVTIGLVYRLGGQRSWRGAAVLAPPVAGLAFGAVAGELIAPSLGGPLAALQPLTRLDAAIALIALDFAVTCRRWRLLRRPASPLEAVHPAAFARRHVLFAVRVLLFDAAPLLLLAAGAAGAAVGAMAAGLVVDRAAFYGLALRRTTEAEVASAEAVMAG